jgi:predicted O-methyltransferase YrrM
MNKYLNELNIFEYPVIIEDVLDQAKTLKTPIISQEGLSLIIQIIRISQAKKVLEIGSAIGYSAMMIALNTNASVLTIERNSDSYQLAKENISKAKLTEKVNLVLGDALEYDLSETDFDLIFIDAAKAQYKKFLEKYQTNLKTGGIIICDNLLFHGLVENKNEIESKRILQLVKKIDEFNSYLINNRDFDTYIYEIGDGMSISIKK